MHLHPNAVFWLLEALERMEQENPNPTVKEEDILDYLAYSLSQVNEVPRALELTERLLALKPDHSGAPGNIIFYKSILENTSRIEPESDVKERKLESVHQSIQNFEHYASLCRGEVVKVQNSKIGSSSKFQIFCFSDRRRNFEITLLL